MGYTKYQVLRLGVRPRERTGKTLLPCEVKEVKAVAKNILENTDELWQYWRLLPFEEGYACQQRKNYEQWVTDEVENLWWDIGRPEFDEDGNWSCPQGGWWPYLDKVYLDISWLKVGSAIINMDEVWTTLRSYLEEKVRGYRMCPGLKLYRVMRRIVEIDEKLGRGVKDRRTRDKMADERKDLMQQVPALVKDYPTDATRSAEDREYYN